MIDMLQYAGNAQNEEAAWVLVCTGRTLAFLLRVRG